MKDLIIVGAYCPDVEREKLLSDCIDSLQNSRDKYDILISTHSFIPEYIHRKVDFVIYDGNNDIITDLKYLNQPWFSPYEGSVIKSTFVGSYSTYLAVYRVLISGVGFAKNHKYEKVHYIEYDSIWNDTTPIDINSGILDDYDSVLVKKEPKNYESNLYWGQGFFISLKLENLDNTFIEFDREKLLNILLESDAKTNEKITEDILRKDGSTIFFVDYNIMLEYDNQYKLSDQTEKESLSGWSVPYYNPNDDKIYVVVWNDRYEDLLSTTFIINEISHISISDINKFGWSIKEVGPIDEVKTITTIVNGKIKNTITFDNEFKDKFKKTNYITIK